VRKKHVDPFWINNVLSVNIEGPVWYAIYHHLPVVRGVNKPVYSSIKQLEKDIYVLDSHHAASICFDAKILSHPPFFHGEISIVPYSLHRPPTSNMARENPNEQVKK